MTAYTSADMEDILVAKLIATSAKQIGLFLIILAIVSAAIVAFIIDTMTLGKIKEIAVLKLIGTRDRTIAAMTMQEALGLGVIGFFVGKFAATLWAPVFPKYILLETGDAVRAFAITLPSARSPPCWQFVPRFLSTPRKRSAGNPMNATQPAILIENLTKRYGSGPTAVDALKGVDMRIEPGEVVGLIWAPSSSRPPGGSHWPAM
jgi:hypothetical protein